MLRYSSKLSHNLQQVALLCYRFYRRYNIIQVMLEEYIRSKVLLSSTLFGVASTNINYSVRVYIYTVKLPVRDPRSPSNIKTPYKETSLQGTLLKVPKYFRIDSIH